MILVATPTYNRSEILIPTLRKLRRDAEASELEVEHIIYDDGSDKIHAKLLKVECQQLNNSRWYRTYLMSASGNLGVKNHWVVVNTIFQEVFKRDFDYFISLHDDMIPCHNFFKRATTHFSFVRKQKREIVAMTLLSSYPGLWGTDKYVDGNYIAVRDFFNVMNWEILPIQTTNGSSGVNRQITEKFMLSERFSLASAPGVSYVDVPRIDSKMFPPEQYPKRPNQYDAVMHNFIDG